MIFQRVSFNVGSEFSVILLDVFLGQKQEKSREQPSVGRFCPVTLPRWLEMDILASSESIKFLPN